MSTVLRPQAWKAFCKVFNNYLVGSLLLFSNEEKDFQIEAQICFHDSKYLRISPMTAYLGRIIDQYGLFLVGFSCKEFSW